MLIYSHYKISSCICAILRYRRLRYRVCTRYTIVTTFLFRCMCYVIQSALLNLRCTLWRYGTVHTLTLHYLRYRIVRYRFYATQLYLTDVTLHCFNVYATSVYVIATTLQHLTLQNLATELRLPSLCYIMSRYIFIRLKTSFT